MLNGLCELLKIELNYIGKEDVFDKANILLSYLNETVVTLDEDDANRYEIESDLRAIFYCLANFNVDVMCVIKDKIDTSNISSYTYMFAETIETLYEYYIAKSNRNTMVL